MATNLILLGLQMAAIVIVAIILFLISYAKHKYFNTNEKYIASLSELIKTKNSFISISESLGYADKQQISNNYRVK